MTKFARLGLAVLGCIALMAVTARAAVLPTFKTDLIVPNQSVAGIKLHAGYAEARSAFHSGGKECTLKHGCGYLLADGSEFSITFAQLTAHSAPIVGQINISVGEKASSGGEKPDFDTPLAALKTANGIGLGSTAAAVRRAYPHAHHLTSSSFTIPGHGETGTGFTLTDGRVSSIQMDAVHLG